MKNHLKFIMALMLSFIGCLMFTPAVAYQYHIPDREALVLLLKADLAMNVGIGIYMIVANQKESYKPFYGTGVLSAVQKEIWVDYVIQNLFKDSSFLNRCFSESDNVLNGVLVHIPQAGIKRRVVRKGN